ncbi:MAG: non-canonical purine NTP pyrophosphatase [Candidatus Poseidoniales archaeon]|nr:MAG: non-canonical purine NTP pyrophosphatase [Candidatus Poseidoniales archaeon]
MEESAGRRQLLFQTGNLGKLAEARHYFEPLGFTVEQFLINGEPPEIIEPQSDDLVTVARSKISQGVALLAGAGRADSALLVEDAGLFIDVLGGFPGVYSSSVLEKLGLDGILTLLQGREQRTALFGCCAAMWDGERLLVGEGNCTGEIAQEARGEHGFGYDPLFIPDVSGADGRTFAQMSPEEKGRSSHRTRAYEQLVLQIG